MVVLINPNVRSERSESEILVKKVGQKVFRGCEKHGDEDGESSGESLVKKIELGGEKVVKKSTAGNM